MNLGPDEDFPNSPHFACKLLLGLLGALLITFWVVGMINKNARSDWQQEALELRTRLDECRQGKP